MQSMETFTHFCSSIFKLTTNLNLTVDLDRTTGDWKLVFAEGEDAVCANFEMGFAGDISLFVRNGDVHISELLLESTAL